MGVEVLREEPKVTPPIAEVSASCDSGGDKATLTIKSWSPLNDWVAFTLTTENDVAPPLPQIYLHGEDVVAFGTALVELGKSLRDRKRA